MFWQSISSFVVSLPNVSEKNVKGLLFRKQPLHTSPNRLKEGNEKKSLSLPWESNPFSWLCLWAEKQSECFKPEIFDELTSAWLSDTIDVFLAEMWKAAPPDSKSKLEETSLLRFVSLLKWNSSKLAWIFYLHRRLTVFLKQKASQIILHKARLLFQPCFRQLKAKLFSIP